MNLPRLGLKRAAWVVLAVLLVVAIFLFSRTSEAPTGFDGQTNGLVDQAIHETDRNDFDEVEDIGHGLGPFYNAQSCRECHQNPASGGVSQITELRVGHRGADGRFENPGIPIANGKEVITGRTLVNDKAICPSADFPDIELQERVPESEDIRTTRLSVNLLGDGFVEAVPDQTLLDVAKGQCRSSRNRICGQALYVPILESPGKTGIGRFGWKDQHASLLSFAADDFLFRQLQAFAQSRGVRCLDEFGLELWSDSRATWPNRNVAALKKLGYLRTFLRFCHDNGWIPEYPGQKLRSPRVTQRPTMPFMQDKMVKILAAAKPGSRVRALVLLLRYTGLRIHDAVTLKRERICGKILLLYTAKTGVLVYCPVPDFVVTALECLPPRGEHFFWTGLAKPKSVASYWQRQLQRLFERAGVTNAHAHRFRDTFAVELPLAGTPIEPVAALLAHTSIKTTERHYAPRTRSRQEQLEADVRRPWRSDLVVFAETEGTSGVLEENQRPN